MVAEANSSARLSTMARRPNCRSRSIRVRDTKYRENIKMVRLCTLNREVSRASS
jgi:hypothetical protein